MASYLPRLFYGHPILAKWSVARAFWQSLAAFRALSAYFAPLRRVEPASIAFELFAGCEYLGYRALVHPLRSPAAGTSLSWRTSLRLAAMVEHAREPLSAAAREHGLRAPASSLQATAAVPPAPKYPPTLQGAWPRHGVAWLLQPLFWLASFLPRKSDAEYSAAGSPPHRTP